MKELPLLWNMQIEWSNVGLQFRLDYSYMQMSFLLLQHSCFAQFSYGRNSDDQKFIWWTCMRKQILTIFFSTIFGLKEPKYFRPTTNTQYTNTITLIFGYVVLDKIYLVFQRLQNQKIKKKILSIVRKPRMTKLGHTTLSM